MSRFRRVAQVGALGLTIAALGAGAFAGKRYAEQRLLASVLGEGTTARGISVHWTRSTGCVEAFETPLPNSRDANENPLSLYADKLWFVFDNAQLMRKRLVMPRIIAEGVLISADVDTMLEPDVLDVDFDLDAGISMPESETAVDVSLGLESPAISNSSISNSAISNSADAQSTVAALNVDASAVTNSIGSNSKASQSELNPSAGQEWIARLAAIRDELVSERFAKSRQVAVDAEMLGERMQLHFENVREQAMRALNEVRDIQLQIQSLDNVLRHELKIMAQRERIEQLKSSLIGLKSEVARSDKTLADELSRLRAALLVEKESLMSSSKEFRAPPAVELASETIERMITRALSEPGKQAILLRDLMVKPFDAVVPTRGRDVRYAAGQLPATDVQSAKLSGELEWDGRRQPFTASGSFKIPAAQSPETTQPRLFPGTAQWQMQIGSGSSAIELSGQSLTSIADGGLTNTTTVHVDDPQNWQSIDFEFRPSQLVGHGDVTLRPWLVKQSESSSLASGRWDNHAITSPYVGQWISYALSNVDEAPETLRYGFTTPVDLTSASRASVSFDEAELWISDSASQWLGQRIANAATTEIADLTVAAAGSLEAHVTQRIVELQRSVAMMRNDADQHLNGQLDELKKIQAAINSNLQQRAGTHFARFRSEEVVR